MGNLRSEVHLQYTVMGVYLLQLFITTSTKVAFEEENG
jgi:hypothetical protein